MIGLLITALLFLVPPLATAEDRPAFGVDLERIAGELLDQTTPERFLRGLFDRALTTIHDYVEVEGSLPSEGTPAVGEFRLKLFPQGRSRSQEHVTAEGSFNLAPDKDQEQLILRFKSSKPPQRSVPSSGEIL